MPNIAVVGAGVVGLSTALCLQKTIPGAQVTIFADKFGSETTSEGPPALFRPNYIALPENNRQLLRKWSDDSFRHFHRLVTSAEAQETGICVISGYLFYNDERKDELYRHVAYSQRFCTEKELLIVPEKYKYGEALATFLIEGKLYLPWLTMKFRLQNGQIEARKIGCLSEFLGKYDVVVNCSGLGSLKLAPTDSELTSQRGQLLRVKAPWIKKFIYAGNSAVIPGRDDVIVAGTMQMNDFNFHVDARDHDVVWEKAVRAVPSLKNAHMSHDWVGLRPYRKSVRLETEFMKFGDQTLPVVHNYGHGSVGVSISWGTAVHATRLTQQLLQQHPASKL